MSPLTNTQRGPDRGTLLRAYSDAWYGHRRLLSNRETFIRQHGDAAFGAALAQAEQAMSMTQNAYLAQPAAFRTPAPRPQGMLGDAFGKQGE